MAPLDVVDRGRPDQAHTLSLLAELERKVLWLSAWMVHNANHLRERPDGLKVGGHQASCASVASLMTALYFHELRPQDRVAVKPHASPVFHAIQYLLGRETRDKLENFRAFGGAQSYPSRTKDGADVDFSTGSVGLGPAMTVFAALARDYVDGHAQALAAAPKEERPGRMIAVVGDAEMDEGNVYEALVEGWKHGLRNCWWIIDYNRQSLDGVVTDQLFRLIDRVFRATGWRVITLKYGKLMREAFAEPGGAALKKWINDCPNSLYSALVFQGGAAWRQQLSRDLEGDGDALALLSRHDDRQLARLMTNLGGHCLATILEAFASVADAQPTCFLAYTIKGYGLPLAGHKDNHAGIMTLEQMAAFRADAGVPEGREWESLAGLRVAADEIERFLARVPFHRRPRARATAASVPVPAALAAPAVARTSTQEAFGRLLNEIGREDSPLARHLVTTSPDVAVSTGLGAWVNRRGLFARARHDDVFHALKVASHQRWSAGETGQHVELGIAENNLFLMLAAFGLAHEMFGVRLLPVGTVYDPFIARGLDALNYACYQGARFIVAGTPSGIALAPEGGAHQSVAAPLIGLGQPGLTLFEPAYADELAEILRHAFLHLQADDGGSVYLRLSTRPLAQPARRLDDATRAAIVAGAYWRVVPGPAAATVLAYAGAVAPEAEAAFARLRERDPEAGLLAVTSADRLFHEWRRQGRDSPAARLLQGLARDARIVSVLDGHPATLAWLGAVGGHRLAPLGVDRFGECGRIDELFRAHAIGADAILDAARAR